MRFDVVSVVLVVAAFGCATGATTADRQQSAGTTATSADGPSQPGTRGSSLSIDCEPAPPCIDCPSVTGNEARVFGLLDKEVIRGVIRSHRHEVKACYDAVAGVYPESKGNMRVRFKIGSSGAVETSCVELSQLHGSVDRCVVDALLRWKFPPPKGGGFVSVSYPFVFVR